MPMMPARRSLSFSSPKSPPAKRHVVLLNRREPMALHCPVIEFPPVPGFPTFPVRNARFMMDWAVRTAS